MCLCCAEFYQFAWLINIGPDILYHIIKYPYQKSIKLQMQQNSVINRRPMKYWYDWKHFFTTFVGNNIGSLLFKTIVAFNLHYLAYKSYYFSILHNATDKLCMIPTTKSLAEYETLFAKTVDRMIFSSLNIR